MTEGGEMIIIKLFHGNIYEKSRGMGMGMGMGMGSLKFPSYVS